MADQQFCLRWNNHQSTLISVFDSLLERGAMVDCTLAAEGQCLQAHKVVLSACSPYLETLLSQHYDKHPILLLKDVKFYELQAMMDYMYRGEVNVAQDKLGMFLKAAESLQIKGLSDSGGNEPPDTGGGSSKRTSKGVPVTNIPRSGGGLTVERRRPQQPLAASQVVDIPSDSGSQDGSESPNLRRKRRRRTSGGGDSAVEGDSSNAGDVSRTQSSSAPLSSDQVPMNGSADSNALGILSSLMDGSVETDSSVQEPGPSLGTSSQTQPSQRIREKTEPPTGAMIQPKSEYLDSEENIEDLTLDDDNGMDNSGMDAGPSQRQGGYQWHMGDQGADEVFMAAQEAVGANRDAQGSTKHLWKFLLELLDNPQFCPRYIKWINRGLNTFRLVDPKMVACLWGIHKNKPDMTYETMGRGMRYYYKRGILAKVKCKGQSHTYKFGQFPINSEEDHAYMMKPVTRPMPTRQHQSGTSILIQQNQGEGEKRQLGSSTVVIQKNQKDIEKRQLGAATLYIQENETVEVFEYNNDSDHPVEIVNHVIKEEPLEDI